MFWPEACHAWRAWRGPFAALWRFHLPSFLGYFLHGMGVHLWFVPDFNPKNILQIRFMREFFTSDPIPSFLFLNVFLFQVEWIFPVKFVDHDFRQGIGVPAAVVSGLSAAHTAAGTFGTTRIRLSPRRDWHKFCPDHPRKFWKKWDEQWISMTSMYIFNPTGYPKSYQNFTRKKDCISEDVQMTFDYPRCELPFVSCWNRSNCFLCHYFISWIFGKLGSVISVVLLRST